MFSLRNPSSTKKAFRAVDNPNIFIIYFVEIWQNTTVFFPGLCLSNFGIDFQLKQRIFFQNVLKKYIYAIFLFLHFRKILIEVSS